MIRVCDPKLPGLAASLDVDAFLARLERSLPECREEFTIEDGRIFDVQYKPGESGVVLYRLKLRERGSGSSRRQYLSVRVLARGEGQTPPSPEVLSRYAALRGCSLRTPYVEIPDQRLVAYAFPLDPVIDLLPAFDPLVMRRVLHTHWRRRGVRVRRVTAHPLGYTPLARAAIRYEVLSEARDDGVPEVRHLIGKIHARKPAARLFAGAWALWRAAKLRVRLAPPVGFLGSLNMSLQERVDGARLGDLADTGTFVKSVRETARSIAIVHGLEVPALSRRTAEKEAQGVHRWGSVLAALRPDHAARVERLRDRITSRLASDTQVSATVHGDFHPANVLADGDHVTLIDLDQMALGDPLLDVGRFLASLRVSSLRVSGDPTQLLPAGQAFLESYLTHREEDEKRVGLFEAACLLTAAATGFRLQRPGWEDNAAVLLDEAARVFDRTEPSSARNKRPAPVTRPAPGVLRGFAEDAVYVRAALDCHVRACYGAEITSCRVERLLSGERHTFLRYRVAGVRDGQRFDASLLAIPCSAGGEHRSLQRIEAVRGALKDTADAPRLPRPIAFLRELRLQVLEEPPGKRLASLVAEASAPEVAARVARALLALHSLDTSLEPERSLASEVEAVRERVEQLDGRYGEVAAVARGARALAARAAERIRGGEPQRAPVLRRLRPSRVLWDGERVAFTEVQHLALSHPLLDAGELLARLRTLEIDREGVDATAVAEQFREAYTGASTASVRDLAAFEALALVRASCWKLEQGGPDAAQRLLAFADAALSAN